MKQSSPLKRTTALVAKTELQRSTPLPRATTTIPRRRKAKPGEAAAEVFTRRVIAERSHGVCELHIPGVCLGRATNAAHRLPQGQGGPWTPSNLLHLCGMGNSCGGCHGYSESHRTESYAKGWLLRTGTDPLTTPVAVWPVGLVLLDDEGGYTQFHPDDLDVTA